MLSGASQADMVCEQGAPLFGLQLTLSTAQSQAQYQPPPEELRKMTQFASTVVRLLEELKRLTTPEGHAPQSSFPEDARPPKRPWEDLSREEVADQSEVCLVLSLFTCIRS